LDGMCNRRLVLCVLAVLSVVAAGVLAFAVPAGAEPCPGKQVPAAAGGFCVPGGPPSPDPTSSATSPAEPAGSGAGRGGQGPADPQPVVTGSGPENVPPQEGVAGQGSTPAPTVSAGSPSGGGPAARPAGAASHPSRSARTLTAAPPDSSRTEAGAVPVAGFLVAVGGGMLLLSSAFGFLRFRPAAR
jgi:hypothetical protein